MDINTLLWLGFGRPLVSCVELEPMYPLVSRPDGEALS